MYILKDVAYSPEVMINYYTYMMFENICCKIIDEVHSISYR